MADEVKTARDQFKYRAFISYSNADRKWAKWLHNALETYRVPKRLVGTDSSEGPIPSRLTPIFRDRDELSTSAKLGNSIREALTESRFLVVICSPHAARSPWVNDEILTFKRLGREDYILPLIVEGEPNASDGKPGILSEAECFPRGLRFNVGADGELTAERTEQPIAGDAREAADGRAAAKLKLIAGIIRIKYDLLRQREHARKVRRLQMSIAAAATLIVILGGLTLFAFSQRREAEARRLEAETELYRSSVLLADALDREGKTELAEETLWKTREDARGWEWGYLLAECHHDLGRFSIQGEGPFGATSSPDGEVGLFWKNQTGTEKGEKEVAPNKLSLLQLSREGVAVKRELNLSGEVVTTKWSADGNRLLVVTAREWVIFDRAGGVLARAKHSGANAANFIDSAGRVFVLSSDGGWSLLQEKDRNYEIAKTVKAKNSWEDIVGDGHGQRWVFLSRSEGHIELNGVREGKLASKEMTWPSDAAFSPDGQRLVVTSLEESVVLWDARRSRSAFTTIAQGINNSLRQTNGCEINWSGEQLLMRSIRGLRVWDLGPDSEFKGENQTPQLPAVAVVMAASAKWIALGLESGQIEVLERESFEPVARLGGHRGKVNQLRIVDDALFSVGEDGSMRVWKLIKAVWSTDGPATDWPGDFLWKESAAFQTALPDSQFRLFSSAHRGSLTFVCRAPTINRIASTGSDGVVRIWDMSAGRILLTLQGFGTRGEAIAFDRTGLLLGTSFFTPGQDQSWNVVWRAMPYRREGLGFIGADWRTAFQQRKEREFRLWWTTIHAGK